MLQAFSADSASTMFLLGREPNRQYLIRLSATLREKIDQAVLQTALQKAVCRYPYFFVRFDLHHGGVMIAPSAHIPDVTMQAPGAALLPNKDQLDCEAQVTFSDRTISIECFHAVSDGMGALQFLHGLIAEYLTLIHHDEHIANSVPMIPIEEQLLDGYRQYGKGCSLTGTHGLAYRLQGTPVANDQASLTCYQMEADEVKHHAKCHGVSVTEYMAALLFMAIGEHQAMSKEHAKKIRLAVPVDLRRRFPCRTMRNFVLNVYPEIDPTTEPLTLAHLCTKLHDTLRKAIAPKRLAGRSAMISAPCELGVMKLLPVSWQKWLVQTSLADASTGCTMTFSNLGVVNWSDAVQSCVTSLDVTFSTKPESPYSCAMISLGNTLRLSLLRTIREPILETQFEKLLTSERLRYERLSEQRTGSRERTI